MDAPEQQEEVEEMDKDDVDIESGRPDPPRGSTVMMASVISGKCRQCYQDVGADCLDGVSGLCDECMNKVWPKEEERGGRPTVGARGRTRPRGRTKRTNERAP